MNKLPFVSLPDWAKEKILARPANTVVHIDGTGALVIHKGRAYFEGYRVSEPDEQLDVVQNARQETIKLAELSAWARRIIDMGAQGHFTNDDGDDYVYVDSSWTAFVNGKKLVV